MKLGLTDDQSGLLYRGEMKAAFDSAQTAVRRTGEEDTGVYPVIVCPAHWEIIVVRRVEGIERRSGCSRNRQVCRAERHLGLSCWTMGQEGSISLASVTPGGRWIPRKAMWLEQHVRPVEPLPDHGAVG